MARRRSFMNQMMVAYEQKQRAKASMERRLAVEADKAAKEAARREKQITQRQADRRLAEARAHRTRVQESRVDQRTEAKYQQVLRNSHQREDARRREQEAKKRDNLAAKRTAAVRARVAVLEGVLLDRHRRLEPHREGARKHFEAGGVEGFVRVLEELLAHPIYPGGEREMCEVRYVPADRRLVIDFQLPGQDVVPDVAEYRHVKVRAAVEPVARKQAEMKAMYRSLIERTTLRVLDMTFRIAHPDLVDRIAFNGCVAGCDPATGRDTTVCLVSAAAVRADFEHVNLDAPGLEPSACLRQLKAQI